jgi:hypothetical protein
MEQTDCQNRYIFDVVEEYHIIIEANNQDEALKKLSRMTQKQKLASLQARNIKEHTGL